MVLSTGINRIRTAVFISGTGSNLRSLVKFIEDLKDTDTLKLEIATGEPIIYKFIDGRFTRA